MIINQLRLTNFKNHLERKFQFSPQINCFVGNNGVGKTNIIDALHYLSVGKSFLGVSDYQNITNSSDSENEEFFAIEAEIKEEDTTDIIKILLPKDAKKLIKKNEKSYSRLADHIGYLPSVIISPYDSNLISDSGESRRKFLDSMISQTDPEYLFSIMQHQKALKQRNALLKSFSKHRFYDADSLQIYEQPLSNYGAEIFRKRASFIAELVPIIQQYYETIANGKEVINVKYQSDLYSEYSQEQHDIESLYKSLLKGTLQKDLAVTYTSAGVHKDDLIFEMNGKALKKLGSQGQQKSFLIALKLAQMVRIKELTGKTPILLLDDIFDKLDDTRVTQLISLVNDENFGQIFITDTNRDRTEQVVKRINEESKIFDITE